MSGESPLEFRAHEEPISACRFLHHDTLLATACHDATIAVWEVCSGAMLFSLCGHAHQVVSIATNKINHTLISGSWDKSLILWDLHTQKEMWRGGHDSLVTTCHTIPELMVTGCDDGSYHYWDVRTGHKVASINAHPTTITCCRLSSNSTDLCTCSMDKSSLLWDNRMHKKLLTLRDHVNVVSGCGFSSNGHYLATCSWDKTVCVYDVNAGSYRRRGPVVLSEHVGSASACSFSSDVGVDAGKLLVSCGYDQDINIWQTSDFQLRNTFRGHEDWIKDIDISEDGKKIVSCSKDGVIRFWNTDPGHVHHSKRRGKPDGLKLATCSTCGRTFSPAGSGADEDSMKLSNSESKELTKKDDPVRLCVFCRLQDPSRMLDQRSSHYLNGSQHTQ